MSAALSAAMGRARGPACWPFSGCLSVMNARPPITNIAPTAIHVFDCSIIASAFSGWKTRSSHGPGAPHRAPPPQDNTEQDHEERDADAAEVDPHDGGPLVVHRQRPRAHALGAQRDHGLVLD